MWYFKINVFIWEMWTNVFTNDRLSLGDLSFECVVAFHKFGDFNCNLVTYEIKIFWIWLSMEAWEESLDQVGDDLKNVRIKKSAKNKRAGMKRLMLMSIAGRCLLSLPTLVRHKYDGMYVWVWFCGNVSVECQGWIT